LKCKQKYAYLKKSSRTLLRRKGKNRTGSRKFSRTLQNKKRLRLKKSSRTLLRRKSKKRATLKKNPRLLIKRLTLKTKKSKNSELLFPKLRTAPRYFPVATATAHRKRLIEFFKQLCFLRSVRRDRRRYRKVKKSSNKKISKKSSKKRFSRKFRSRR